ncbi:MAG TPA: Hpt domain-containing protein [Gemmatimonadales bacterium]|nr:Hpt domain-containing protein [Gemmatimonadales bacterium]
MVPDPDDLLTQQLRQLRREYLVDSIKRVEELRALQAALAGDQQAVLVRLRQAFHKLAGSGGSYGFPVVSARSREGEALVQRLEAVAAPLTAADRASIEACITSIDRAFADARSSMESSP